MRGSGVEHDLRRKHPYLDYDQYDFDVVIGSSGDCYDRYLVRIEEMRQSVRILRQAIEKLPGGPINVSNWKNDSTEVASNDENGRVNSPFHRGH